MNLDAIFSPQKIALIGASRDERSVGFSLLKNLLSPSYKGTVFPINPHADTLLGKRVFHTIDELPEKPDLAIVAIPAIHVLKTVEELGKKGFPAVLVISAGFKEAGEEGRQRETDLVTVCTTYGTTLIGPNCLGIVNPHLGLNASFETVLPEAGSIAFISQSGALISSLLDIARHREIGFSKVISVGNKAMVSELELLPYLFHDPQTKVILLYSEVLTDAQRIIHIVRENNHADNPKPVILLKAGITPAGQKASSSHTGSLAGSDAAYEALVAQAGIIRVKTINEMLSTASVFTTSRLPRNRNLAIITNAGGPGIIATDEADRIGLHLPLFDNQTEQSLRAVLPQSSHVANPVDVLGDATSSRYEQTIHAVLRDDTIQSVLTIVTPQSMTDIPETAEAIVRAQQTSQKLVVASFMGEPLVKPGVDILARNNVPHMQFPEDAVKAIGHAVRFYEITQKPYRLPNKSYEFPSKIQTIIQSLKTNNVHLVNMETTFTLLSLCGLPLVKSVLVQSAEEAEKEAENFQSAIAMKIVSPDISHKTDVGGVRLRVQKQEAGSVFKEIVQTVSSHVPNARTHGVLMTEMIEGDGIELIVGIKRETGLGTLIMLGVGGIYVEVLRDVVFRFAPLTDYDVQDMIDALKAKQLLYGFRGAKRRDLESLYHVLMILSSLALQIPEIEELDINPLFLREEGQGCVILDARIILK
ncbi:MAG: acetate--CoA ligase family protein [Patescibacteria group bacterium]|nr:acetate--CoA ligase family protein [Patescibacteria group bacterium]